MEQTRFFTASSLPLNKDAVESTIHLAKLGEHDGKRFKWTADRFQEMVDNFKAGAYGLFDDNKNPILFVNYNHNREGEAAGWVTDIFVANGGEDLMAKVSWTEDAVQAIRKKKYRYASAEWYSNYMEDGQDEPVGFVLGGIGLVNDPAIKGLQVLTANKKTKESKMPNYESAAATTLTLQDVLGWLASAPEEEKLKVVETAGGVMTDPAKTQQPQPNQNPMQEPQNTQPPAQPHMQPQQNMTVTPQQPPHRIPASGESQMPETASVESLQKQLAEAQSQLQQAQRASQFAELLAAGKAVEAQRDAFLKNDMFAFAQAAVSELNMTQRGISTNRLEQASSQLDENDKKAAAKAGQTLEEYRAFKQKHNF